MYWDDNTAGVTSPKGLIIKSEFDFQSAISTMKFSSMDDQNRGTLSMYVSGEETVRRMLEPGVEGSPFSLTGN